MKEVSTMSGIIEHYSEINTIITLSYKKYMKVPYWNPNAFQV